MVEESKKKKEKKDKDKEKKEKGRKEKDRDKKEKTRDRKDKKKKDEGGSAERKLTKKNSKKELGKAKKSKGDEKKKRSSKSDKKGSSKNGAKKKNIGVCVICKDPEIDAAIGGMCDHIFCITCFKQVVHNPMENPGYNDNHLAAPTLGRCPRCKKELRKFEAKRCKAGKVLEKSAFAKQKMDIPKSKIFGKIYVPANKEVQLGNFCFDDQSRPYIDFKDAIAQDKEKWLMNDGSQIPERKEFERGCFFDNETRTFHGKIKWNDVTFRGAHQWDVTLAFRKGFAAIHVGVIHERKERIIDKDDQKKKKPEENVRLQYPLDGAWRLFWKDIDGNEKSGKVTVRNNAFNQGPYLFNLNFSDPKHLTFKWPLDPVIAEAKSGVNLKDVPMGPEIGERIVWDTSHPAFQDGFIWERESIGEYPVQPTIHFGIGNNEYLEKGNESSAAQKEAEENGTDPTEPPEFTEEGSSFDGSSDEMSTSSSDDSDD
eukprot:scaffold24173_cov162-Cylindrotheca_fusiformis.AAC.4